MSFDGSVRGVSVAQTAKENIQNTTGENKEVARNREMECF